MSIILVVWTASAGAGEALPGAREVSWEEAPGQWQGYPKLVVAPLPGLDTEVIYARRGLTFPKMKGFVVIYPGTSGHIHSDFGLIRSLGPLANLLVSEGYGVLAFRQAIYNHASDPVLRAPFLKKYGNLEGNLDWLMKTIAFALSHLPHAHGRPSVPLYYIGRSTGTGLGLEALHRYMKRDPGFRSLAHFKSMLMMSVDGHTPEAIQQWHEAEVREFIQLRPETGDAPVVMACPHIFKDMQWQTESISPEVTRGLKLPLVYLTVGSRDEFTAPHVSLRPIVDFSKMHPGLFSGLLFHDGFHNPNRAIPNVLGADTMTRTALLVSYLLYPFDRQPEPGFHAAFTPSPEMVTRPMESSERKFCHDLLTEGGAWLPHGLLHVPDHTIQLPRS